MRLLLSLSFTVFTTALFACSCFPIENFCESIRPEYIDSYRIYRGTIVDIYDLSQDDLGLLQAMDVELEDQYFGGDLQMDFLTLVGNNGANCGAELSPFSEGEEIIFYITGELSVIGEEAQEQYPYLFKMLDGCGVSYLKVTDNLITGPITPDVDEQPLDNFLIDLQSCLDFTSGANEAYLRQNTRILPNPTTDRLTVSFFGVSSYENIRLYNALGQEIARRPVVQLENFTVDFDVSHLPAGVYTIVMETAALRIAEKEVVQ